MEVTKQGTSRPLPTPSTKEVSSTSTTPTSPSSSPVHPNIPAKLHQKLSQGQLVRSLPFAPKTTTSDPSFQRSSNVPPRSFTNKEADTTPDPPLILRSRSHTVTGVTPSRSLPPPPSHPAPTRPLLPPAPAFPPPPLPSVAPPLPPPAFTVTPIPTPSSSLQDANRSSIALPPLPIRKLPPAPQRDAPTLGSQQKTSSSSSFGASAQGSNEITLTPSMVKSRMRIEPKERPLPHIPQKDRSSHTNNDNVTAKKQLVRRAVAIDKKFPVTPPPLFMMEGFDSIESDDGHGTKHSTNRSSNNNNSAMRPQDSRTSFEPVRGEENNWCSDIDSSSDSDFDDLNEEECGRLLRRQISNSLARPAAVRIDKSQLANVFNEAGPVMNNSLPTVSELPSSQPAPRRRRSISARSNDEMQRESVRAPLPAPNLVGESRSNSADLLIRRRAATIDRRLVSTVLASSGLDLDESEESQISEIEKLYDNENGDNNNYNNDNNDHSNENDSNSDNDYLAVFKGRPPITPMPVDYGLLSDQYNLRKVTPIALIGASNAGRAGRGTIFFSSEQADHIPEPISYDYYQNEIEQQIDLLAMEKALLGGGEEAEDAEEDTVIELPSDMEKRAQIEAEIDDTQLAEDGSEILFLIPHSKLYVIENGRKEFIEEGPLFVLWLNEEFVTKAMATDQSYLLKRGEQTQEHTRKSAYDGRLVIRVGNILVSFLQFHRPTLCPKPFKYCFMLLNTFFMVKLPNKPPYMAKRETRLSFEYYLENYSAFIKLDDYGHVIETPSKTKMEFFVQPDGTLKYTRPRTVAKPPPQAVLLDKFALKIEEAGLEISKGIITTAHLIASGISAANRTFKKHTKPCQKPVKVHPLVAKGLVKTQVIAEQRILKGAEKIGGTIEKFSMLAGSKVVGVAKWVLQGNPAKEAEMKERKMIEFQEKVARGEVIEEEYATLGAAHHVVACSVDALVSVLRSVEDALEIIVLEIRDSTVDGLTYRYGDEVGVAAHNALDAAAKTTFAAYKVYAATSEVYLAKNIGLGVIAGISEGISKELGGEPWKVGFIKLQGLLIEGWVERLFILRTKSLSWIIPDEKANQEEPNGYISLNDIQKVEVIPPDRSFKPNMFRIRMRKMSRFYMYCDTHHEMLAWINAILTVKSFCDVNYKYAFEAPKPKVGVAPGRRLIKG